MNSQTLPLSPVAIGTGLLALDVVIAGDSLPFAKAGGSCGNVLSILSWLGWESFPVARLDQESAAEWLVADLENVGVTTEFVERSEGGSTPIIVHRISQDRFGKARHRFERVCIHCKTWFPSYKPALVRDFPSLEPKLPIPRAFYFDRASAASLALANWCHNNGALVVFEPPSWKDHRLWYKAVEISDVLKFAHDRFSVVSNSPLDKFLIQSNIAVTVETRGRDGLRYRRGGESAWRELASYTLEGVSDTAGAGDWTTAGMIHLLGEFPRTDGVAFEMAKIEDALDFGQALAAVNCLFHGARGAMDAISVTDILRMTSLIRATGETPVCEVRLPKDLAETQYCPTCAQLEAA